MSTVRALVIAPHATPQVVDTKGDLDSLRALIGGGWLEGVGAADDRSWHAYCDEEGKMKRASINALATDVALSLGWPVGDVLCGTVVFLGSRPDGDEGDVPEHVVNATWRLWDGP